MDLSLTMRGLLVFKYGILAAAFHGVPAMFTAEMECNGRKAFDPCLWETSPLLQINHQLAYMC